MNTNYRIILFPEDHSEYEHGDVTPEERAEIDAQIASDGLWYFRVDKRIAMLQTSPEFRVFSEWEDVDGCAGFIGTDFDSNGMAEHFVAELAGQQDVPVYDGDDIGEHSQPVAYFTAPKSKRARRAK